MKHERIRTSCRGWHRFLACACCMMKCSVFERGEFLFSLWCGIHGFGYRKRDSPTKQPLPNSDEIGSSELTRLSSVFLAKSRSSTLSCSPQTATTEKIEATHPSVQFFWFARPKVLEFLPCPFSGAQSGLFSPGADPCPFPADLSPALDSQVWPSRVQPGALSCLKVQRVGVDKQGFSV